MEKKKKGKGIGIGIAVVIIVLAAAGYLVYDTVFKQNVSDVPEVEVKEVGSVNADFNSRDSYAHKEIFKILDKNDATFYEIKEEDGKMDIFQCNEKDFNSVGSVKAKTAEANVKDSMNTFLNTKYDSLPSTIYASDSPDYQTTIFGRDMGVLYDDWVIETFGEELGKMFKDYKLKLSCDINDIEVEKMAVYDTKHDIVFTMEGIASNKASYEYYIVTTAKVTTEAASKKISELGVFPDKGESKKIKLFFHCNSFEGLKSLELSGVYR